MLLRVRRDPRGIFEVYTRTYYYIPTTSPVRDNGIVRVGKYNYT